MNCFAHETVAAVGACKSCGKGLCRSCSRDLGFAIVCSDSCAVDATGNHEMTIRARRMYGIGVPGRTPTGVVVWSLFAILFLGWGMIESFNAGRIIWFPILFGVVACVIAALVYRRTKELGLRF